MFVTDKLVYLETQKTGGTHIRKLMERYVGGRSVGKHNRLSGALAKSHFIFGSIRNPWDWYVSLWAYGVGGKGAIRRRCLRGIDFHYYNRLLPKSMGKNLLSPYEYAVSISHDAFKPVSHWRNAYSDTDSPDCFKSWLKLLFDKRRRFDVGEGFGFSPLSMHAGLLTYRYFRLFTLGDDVFRDPGLGTREGLTGFDKKNNIASAMIRTEALEEDFISVLSKAGYEFKNDILAAIRNNVDGRTNVSERRAAEFYYDEETSYMVAERDRYLIEKYGYSPPKLTSGTS